MYRLEIDGEVMRVIEGVTISNGIGWRPDSRLMYYVDTATQDIDRFDFDLETGRIRNRQTLASVPKASGSPDGHAVDREGCIWVAIAKGAWCSASRPKERSMRLYGFPWTLSQAVRSAENDSPICI